MKKWLGITVGISVAIVCGAAVMIGVRQTPMERETFEFSPEVYEKGEFREITADEFEQMIAVKKRFRLSFTGGDLNNVTVHQSIP